MPLFRKFAVLILILSMSPFLERANALDEKFELYNAPQALGMGNAFTADATGYTALFYNPAGLAKGESRHPEITPVAIEFQPGFGGLGSMISTRSIGTYQLARHLVQSPNSYDYFRANVLPSFIYNGFGVAFLGSYQFAGQSDGTLDDINATTDYGIVAGGAMNFFGNRLKIGVAGKVIDRNQLKGTYDPASFTSDQGTAAMMKEGIGYGGDLGVMFSLPEKYLPTIAATWKDVLGTYFHAAHFQNPSASGVPDKIDQEFNAAVSVHPSLSAHVRGTFTVEYRHLELPNLAFRKKLHIGMQLITDKSFYFWAGMNELYPCFGMAMRVPGGNLELGTYAEDVGYGNDSVSDRRIFFRYTIGF